MIDEFEECNKCSRCGRKYDYYQTLVRLKKKNSEYYEEEPYCLCDECIDEVIDFIKKGKTTPIH